MKARPHAPFKRYRKKNYRRYNQNKLFRSVYPNAVYTASENYNWGTLTIPAGGNTASNSLNIAMNSIPQVQDYAKLFRQFCVKHVTYKLVPRFGEVDVNNTLSNFVTSGTGYASNGRMHYSIVDTPFVGAPGSEGAILQNNNVKTRLLSGKIIKISQAHPKPETTVSFNGSNQTNSTLVGDQWFNFTDATASTTNGGQNVVHGNVQVYILCPGNFPNGLIMFDVYAKVTFACRNPA